MELSPQSVNFSSGLIRCRSRITPLYAACINENIPLSIVEFLLKSGAYVNSTIEVINSNPIKIIDDLKVNLDKIVINLFLFYLNNMV